MLVYYLQFFFLKNCGVIFNHEARSQKAGLQVINNRYGYSKFAIW